MQTSVNRRRIHAGNRCCQHKQKIVFQELSGDSHCQRLLMDNCGVCRGGSTIFFKRGCTRLLLYLNTNKLHSFFFGIIPVVLENRRSSPGGGAHPLHPPPRSAPAQIPPTSSFWRFAMKELECILFAVLFVSQWGKIEKST